MPPIEALTGILKNYKNRELCSFINSLYSNVPSTNPIFLYIQEKCPSIMNKHNKLMDTFFLFHEKLCIMTLKHTSFSLTA